MRIILALALLALPSLVRAASPPADAADLVLRRGAIYPVEPAGRIDGSLAVRDGRIVYVGPDAGVEALVGPATRVVELEGRAVVPGLVDAHAHLEGLGQALESVDLTGADSYEEIVRRVAETAAGRPAGSWILGRGWDQNRWPDKAFPVHGPLSAAVPDHPVWLERVDGHASLLNAAAMAAVGLQADDEDPAGGRILRDPEGAPTGVLVDNAAGVYASRLPGASAADHRRQVRLGAEAAAAVGLTTVTDMGVGPETVAAYRALAAAGELPVRAALFWSGDRPDLASLLGDAPPVDPDARVLVRGVKLYADGALGSRGAALIEPYADDPDNLGLLVTPGPRLEAVARLALERGYQVGIHGIGDRGNLIALDAIEAAFGGRPRPEARFRIEHAQVIRRQDLARMGRLGIVASMQPTHATSDMPWAPDRLGPERLDRAYPWRQALELGVPLAFGSDFPVERPEPLLGLHAAVTRQDLEGRPEGGWLPGERLTPEEALRAFTLDAAWSLFLEDEVGSLEPGKRADLVVLDRDPFAAAAPRFAEAAVDLTVVDGEVVFAREGTE